MSEPPNLSPSAMPHETIAQSSAWTLISRFVFRFVFSYVVLFLFSFSGFFAPLSLPVATLSRAIWAVLIPWVSTHLLNVPPPALYSDGDGLGQWIQFIGCLVLALFATLIWSLLDRRRLHYEKLHQWLQVILRYSLGIAMFTYGMVKIFHLQMLPPHLAKLIQPYGESSPTSLLWIFMGSSAAYSAFAGAVELLGGLLLFKRKTATLGALVTLGAMVHVFVMNLSFDVSVKIWSMNLTALSVILLAPDLRRLMNIFILNQPADSVEYPRLFSTPKKNRVWFIVGMICLAITLGLRLFSFFNGYNRSYQRTPVPIYGIYEVDSFSANGVTLPPLLTDDVRWKTLVIERSGLASIIQMDDDPLDYITSVDADEGTVSFIANPDETQTSAGATRLAYDPRLIERRYERASEGESVEIWTLRYSRTDGGQLSLTGDWSGDAIDVRLNRIDESEFLLLNRGFHWVQFYPFFR